MARRILALVEGVDHVCCRYRLRAFDADLCSAGYAVEYREIPAGIFRIFPLARAARSADLVLVQRKLFAPWEVATLRRASARLWLDVDDALWMRDSFSGRGFADRKRNNRFKSAVRNADLILCGNEFLADAARSLRGDANAVILATTVELARYRPSAGARAPEVTRLVWVGSSSTLPGLGPIHAPLQRLGATLTGLRLRVLCDRFPVLPGLIVEQVPWSESTEADAIAECDIGISYVPDDPWSRGKCGLKILQYMAAGLPVIANPVGVHPQMVSHGVSGLLASTPEEWENAVRLLSGDPELRKKMGRAARRIVEERYSTSVGAKILIGELDRAFSSTPSP